MNAFWIIAALLTGVLALLALHPIRRERRLTSALVIALPLVVLALYIPVGSPDLQGAPLGPRLQARAAALDVMMSELAPLLAVAKVHDNDPAPQIALGAALREAGFAAEASGYFARAHELTPSDTVVAGLLGETRVAAADGRVTDAARDAFVAALNADPTALLPRHFLALRAWQDGDVKRARMMWQKLLEDAPADAPWRETVRAFAEAAGAVAGTDNSIPIMVR
ncbi:MAG: hypothetical protein U9N14_04495 [Pseudomonadota bacterium]|nr:hypothetical protein [Pseudomonadota bacterium]